MGDKAFAAVALTAIAAATATGVLLYNMNEDKDPGAPKRSLASEFFSSFSSPGNSRNSGASSWKRKQISERDAHEFWMNIVSLNDFEILDEKDTKENLNSIPVFKRSTRAKETLRLWGVPSHLRPLIWPILCNLNEYKKKVGDESLYKRLSQNIVEGFNGKSPIELDIEKDLDRTFPEEKFFQRKEGLNILRRILVSFSRFRSNIGYCQSLNFVAGAFLIAGLSEEQSFWMLDLVVNQLLPENYYSSNMAGLKRDMAVFEALCNDEIPKIQAHLTKHDVAVFHYGTSWFLCLFLNVLKFENSMRFMDIFLYEGTKAIFRVAIGLLKLHEKQILKCNSLWDIVTLLKTVPTSSQITDFSDLFQPDWDLEEISNSRIAELRAREDSKTANDFK